MYFLTFLFFCVLKMFKAITFCESGACWRISFIKLGRTLVIWRSPPAKVRSSVVVEISCPWRRACSWYWRAIESTTYNTPSLCVPGDKRKCLYSWVTNWALSYLSEVFRMMGPRRCVPWCFARPVWWVLGLLSLILRAVLSPEDFRGSSRIELMQSCLLW